MKKYLLLFIILISAWYFWRNQSEESFSHKYTDNLETNTEAENISSSVVASPTPPNTIETQTLENQNLLTANPSKQESEVTTINEFDLPSNQNFKWLRKEVLSKHNDLSKFKEFLNKWLPHYSIRLIGLKQYHYLGFHLSENQILYQTLRTSQNSNLIFQNGRLVEKIKISLDESQAFCQADFQKRSHGNTDKFENSQNVLYLKIENTVESRWSRPNFNSVSILFNKEQFDNQDKAIYKIECFYPSSSKDDDSFRNMTVLDLFYSFGTRGFID